MHQEWEPFAEDLLVITGCGESSLRQRMSKRRRSNLGSSVLGGSSSSDSAAGSRRRQAHTHQHEKQRDMLGGLNLPCSLSMLEALQLDHCQEVVAHLENRWRRAVVDFILDNMSERYDLYNHVSAAEFEQVHPPTLFHSCSMCSMY